MTPMRLKSPTPQSRIKHSTTETLRSSFANSEDPDEMPHYAAIHLGLHCLLKQNQSSKKNAITTCNPSIYTMVHPDFIVCSFMENSIGLKRVNYSPLVSAIGQSFSTDLPAIC